MKISTLAKLRWVLGFVILLLLASACSPPNIEPVDWQSPSDPLDLNSSEPGQSTVTAIQVTLEDAQAMFDNMAVESNIAFNYPIDGCYARAHIMIERLQEKYNVTPRKIWAFGRLSVDTDTPYGTVTWRYHVAPVIDVTNSDGSTTTYVIDPSIASGPVTVEKWLEIMHAPEADTQITELGQPPTNPSTGQPFDGSDFWPGSDPSDDLDGYSADLMEDYMNCAERSTIC